MSKIFSRKKIIYLFKNRYLSLAGLVLIQLLLMLRPSWNKVDKVVSTLSQRCTPTLYQGCATLKIWRRILFHFQRRVNFISTLIHNVETTLIRCWNVGWVYFLVMSTWHLFIKWNQQIGMEIEGFQKAGGFGPCSEAILLV